MNLKLTHKYSLLEWQVRADSWWDVYCFVREHVNLMQTIICNMNSWLVTSHRTTQKLVLLINLIKHNISVWFFNSFDEFHKKKLSDSMPFFSMVMESKQPQRILLRKFSFSGVSSDSSSCSRNIEKALPWEFHHCFCLVFCWLSKFLFAVMEWCCFTIIDWTQFFSHPKFVEVRQEVFLGQKLAEGLVASFDTAAAELAECLRGGGTTIACEGRETKNPAAKKSSWLPCFHLWISK